MIPADVRPTLGLTDFALERELLGMTDLWTDELFPDSARQSDTVIVYPVSRLVVDPERFEHDDPMDVKGIGAVYLKTSDGKQLRSDILDVERLPSSSGSIVVTTTRLKRRFAVRC